MTSRVPIRRALALALALSLLPLASAHADREDYERVADAYATGGGQLSPCSFSRADLESALAGIPRNVIDVVPDLRRAIEDAIAAHGRGECSGIEPDGGATGAATTPAAPGAATTPSPDDPVSSTDPTGGAAAPPTPSDPGAGVTPGASGSPTTIAPGEAATTPSRQRPGVARDRTPLVVGAGALGALLLLALALWGLARMRGWDPEWAARARHAWGEAAYRTTTVWSEFADWLRLGR